MGGLPRCCGEVVGRTGDNRALEARIEVDNAGREMVAWVEATGGREGGAARLMQVLLAADGPVVDWEITLDIRRLAADHFLLKAWLGFEPLLRRAAVPMRFDPVTAPGLFR